MLAPTVGAAISASASGISPVPIVIPGGDDFQYIDIDGNLLTESNRENHYRQVRDKMPIALKYMDSMNTPWEILELEMPFYDLVRDLPKHG